MRGKGIQSRDALASAPPRSRATRNLPRPTARYGDRCAGLYVLVMCMLWLELLRVLARRTSLVAID